MSALNDKDYKLLITILKTSPQSLKHTIDKVLIDKFGYAENKVHLHQDYLYAEGDIPVALIAHLDTVFPHPPSQIFYDREQNVIWSPQGAGFDDRAGVFAIIKLLQSGYRPYLIFTTDEETGAISSQEVGLLDPPPIKYMVELDRHGIFDCVFYDDINNDFKNYVEGFGFKTAKGLFSDISFIAPLWGISAVNLSIGYFREHSQLEYLVVDATLDTIEKVKLMLNDINNSDSFCYEQDSTYVCEKCGTPFSIFNPPIGINTSNQIKYFCEICLDDGKRGKKK